MSYLSKRHLVYLLFCDFVLIDDLFFQIPSISTNHYNALPKLRQWRPFFQKIKALEKSIFLFSLCYFSQLWRTLVRKLMERPIVFITYFESPFQIVHVYQVFRSGYFFSKILWRFQYNIHFFPFLAVLPEKLRKNIPILWLIFKCFIVGRSQNFVIWKCLLRKWRLWKC